MRTSTSLALASLVAVSGCSDVEPSTTTARVRIAHLSPDAPPVDVCIAPAGTGEFTGPLLGTGLAFGSVTKYLDVEATQYDVRLVAPGAADCTTPLGGLPDFTELPALPDGASATIAAEGHVNGTVGFRLAAYIDDTDVTFGKAKLRFIHASPNTPAVDIGLGGGVAFTPVFENIAFGASGYVETAPLDHNEISARATGTIADVIAIKPAPLPAGAIATAFAIGEIGNAHAPLDILLCVDNAPAADVLSQCKRVGAAPERAHVRIAHLSPDAPPVDVCIAEAGSGSWSAPLLRTLGATSGLAYSQVTAYVDLPVRSYDVRVILATATGCEAGAVPDTTGIAVTKDLTATIAALGVLDRSGAAANDPAFRLQVLADETTVGSGMTKLRFFHASPGTPAVDVGLTTAHGFTSVFANVAFGGTATPGGAMSAAGFVETAPITANVSARLAGAHIDALTIPNVTLGANAIASAFAIGGKTGTHANPLQVLLCADSSPAKGLLSDCTVAP